MGRKKTLSDEELLEVARQEFLTNGIGASTKSIAQKAGISEGVIFQRFHTKEELFEGRQLVGQRLDGHGRDHAVAVRPPGQGT